MIDVEDENSSNLFDLTASAEEASVLSWAVAVLPGLAVFWPEIEHAYSADHRKFHTIKHLSDVLAMHKFAASQGAFKRIEEALLALLFHDFVLEPGIGADHEYLSSKVGRLIAGSYGCFDCDLVEQHILATTDRIWTEFIKSPSNSDVSLVVDCDNAIWAAGSKRYDQYARDLERESLSSGSSKFLVKRRRRLQELARAPRLFLSDLFESTFSAHARENIRRELSNINQRLNMLISSDV